MLTGVSGEHSAWCRGQDEITVSTVISAQCVCVFVRAHACAGTYVPHEASDFWKNATNPYNMDGHVLSAKLWWTENYTGNENAQI